MNYYIVTCTFVLTIFASCVSAGEYSYLFYYCIIQCKEIYLYGQALIQYWNNSLKLIIILLLLVNYLSTLPGNEIAHQKLTKRKTAHLKNGGIISVFSQTRIQRQVSIRVRTKSYPSLVFSFLCHI